VLLAQLLRRRDTHFAFAQALHHGVDVAELEDFDSRCASSTFSANRSVAN